MEVDDCQALGPEYHLSDVEPGPGNDTHIRLPAEGRTINVRPPQLQQRETAWSTCPAYLRFPLVGLTTVRPADFGCRSAVTHVVRSLCNHGCENLVRVYDAAEMDAANSDI